MKRKNEWNINFLFKFGSGLELETRVCRESKEKKMGLNMDLTMDHLPFNTTQKLITIIYATARGKRELHELD